MNIVAEFAQMQNSEWLDAKMWLDDSASVSELTKCKVLCYVMKVPYFNSKFSLIIVLIVCSRMILVVVGLVFRTVCNMPRVFSVLSRERLADRRYLF